ncbi:acetyl-CoA acetyltransferase [Amycolatopsis granulosa]|uniref:acetyl-CoA acetyltransferase n=1 Tax=Amycolatopsis granulosa TaxID=185684 RepID=UPI00141FBAAD|nr:acetyl-CoA acetyltransferase [Amycolatopsis granulosa]NIH85743.1 acetyl-CoA C-acetyltransferase [Amycolatopsis granulosa]
MADAVHVLGGAQTDFAVNWSKQSDNPLFDMLEQAVRDCLAATGLEPSDIATAHVGNFGGERFAGQSHLGAMIPMLDPAWATLPTSRHEAACASSSAAALAAMAEIEAGRYDVVLVAGVELMRNVAGEEAARNLGSAAWTPEELDTDELPWPHLFDRISQEVERRYGLDQNHLNRIAELNRTNARRNPLAQTRGWTAEPGHFEADDLANPIVTGRTRKSDCGRITDGASAIVLAGSRFTESWLRGSPDRTASRISGWGHHTAPLPLRAKFANEGRYLFPNIREAITDAYGRAGVRGPEDLDVIETHDCFTITEYVAIDHFGLTAPGEAWRAIESGYIDFDGRLPVNPSGGLIGAGHPVGATGVRMLLDAHRQVTGTAGDYQVPGARTAATLNVGGSCSTAVSFVVTA